MLAKAGMPTASYTWQSGGPIFLTVPMIIAFSAYMNTYLHTHSYATITLKQTVDTFLRMCQCEDTQHKHTIQSKSPLVRDNCCNAPKCRALILTTLFNI